jgi:hypothetical protein
MQRDEIVQGLLLCAEHADELAKELESRAKPAFEGIIHRPWPDEGYPLKRRPWVGTWAVKIEMIPSGTENSIAAKRMHQEAQLFRAAAELLKRG